MSVEQQSNLLSSEFLAEAEQCLATGWSLPYSLINNPGICDFERTAIFESSWQIIGVEDSVAKPGERLVSRIGNVPVLIVRGEDGVLRGFVNVCRHRGYPVAREDGCSRLLTCRYHGWTYDLTGGLVKAPEMTPCGEDLRAELSLKPVSVATWRGCVFAHADPLAPGLLETFPELEKLASGCAFDLSSYRPHSTFTIEIACDWKLAYDNVVECYHCASMHAETLNTLYEADGFEDATWQTGARLASARLKGSGALHHCLQLFPGNYLVQDSVIGIAGRFFPVGLGRTRLEFNFLMAPDASPEDVDRFVALWRETLNEDRAILEAQQQGICAGRLERGRLVSGPENSVAAVQQLILDAYRSALEDRRDTGTQAFVGNNTDTIDTGGANAVVA